VSERVHFNIPLDTYRTFQGRVFPAMVLTKQTYSTKDKHKTPETKRNKTWLSSLSRLLRQPARKQKTQLPLKDDRPESTGR